MAETLIARLKVTTDYYEILEVERDATEKQLKFSYRKKALLLHPDRCKLPDAKEAFQKLSNAHMCLSDPVKRKRYDVSGSDSDTPNPFAGGGAGSPFPGGFEFRGGGGLNADFFEQVFRAAQQQGGMGGFRMGGGMPGTFRFSTSSGFDPFQQQRPRRRRRPQQPSEEERVEDEETKRSREAAHAAAMSSPIVKVLQQFLDPNSPPVWKLVGISILVPVMMAGLLVLTRYPSQLFKALMARAFVTDTSQRSILYFMATSFFFWEDLFGTFNVVGALMFLWGVCNLPLKVLPGNVAELVPIRLGLTIIIAAAVLLGF